MMSMSSRTLGFAGLVLAVALTGGCPPKQTTPPSGTGDTDEDVVQPSISSVQPSQIDLGEAAEITISGREFQSGLGVEVGGERCTNPVVMDSRRVSCTVSPELALGSHSVVVTNPDGGSATRRGGFEVLDPDARAGRGSGSDGPCEIRVISFDYDTHSLSDDARRTIEHNARCVEENGHNRLRVVGHCDDRGSTEYNLSLGQRRADSVREYLLNLGVEARMTTVSYGEEQPLDRGQNEAAWARNRRVELMVE